MPQCPHEISMLERYLYSHVYCSTLHNRKLTGLCYMPTDGWMNKEFVVHINNGILLTYKKEWNYLIDNNTNGKERQIPCIA